MPDFKSFGKIPRLANLQMILTEKIDGTNACVVVDEEGNVSAQSRRRIITPEADNYGFAKWVQENAEELQELGPGYHFGEWYGQGIQRSYGLKERRFALFNVTRWGEERPACCEVVPLLHKGPFDSELLDHLSAVLYESGSQINIDYQAEGMMIFVSPLNVYIKDPFDPAPKGN